MTLTKLFKHTRCLTLLLITSLLISCSASQHTGVTTIKEPLLLEDKVSTWFLYYQDQFDANEGNVLPPTTQYPQSAIRGYQQAKIDWDDKVENAKSETIISYVGLGVVAVVITLIIIDTLHRPFSAGI